MESGNHKALTLATMCIATFVAILDTTVVNLALHTIQSQLHTTLRVLQWVLDLHNLSYASFIMASAPRFSSQGRSLFSMSPFKKKKNARTPSPSGEASTASQWPLGPR
jgi:MFS family permease